MMKKRLVDQSLSKNEINAYGKRVNDHGLTPQEAMHSIECDREWFSKKFHTLCDAMKRGK